MEQVSEEEYAVDHLKRLVKERNNSRWKYPATDNMMRTIHLEQLLDVKVGDWDLMQNERSIKSLLRNVKEVQKHFKMRVNKI